MSWINKPSCCRIRRLVNKRLNKSAGKKTKKKPNLCRVEKSSGPQNLFFFFFLLTVFIFIVKLSLSPNRNKGNECVCGKIRGTFDQYFKCLPCEGVAETLTILRSCFNEAAVAALTITRLNCQCFALKLQLLRPTPPLGSLLLCFIWRPSCVALVILTPRLRVAVFDLWPLRLVQKYA